MKKSFISGLLFTVLLLLSACGASVKMIGSWTNDSMAGYHIDNVLVIGISRQDITRNLWEDTFVELLGKENIKAQASHIVMAGKVMEPDRQSVISAVKKSGADTVLITRVVDSKSVKEETPGVVYFEPAPFYVGMNDYFGHAYSSVYSQPVSVSKTTVRLESNVYDVATEKLIWTAQSEVIDPELLKTDFDKMVNVFLADLQKKKLI